MVKNYTQKEFEHDLGDRLLATSGCNPRHSK